MKLNWLLRVQVSDEGGEQADKHYNANVTEIFQFLTLGLSHHIFVI
jgi:hypothetical protein